MDVSLREGVKTYESESKPTSASERERGREEWVSCDVRRIERTCRTGQRKRERERHRSQYRGIGNERKSEAIHGRTLAKRIIASVE